MSKFGLIGYPLEGSLSPRLFEAAYKGRWRYDLIEDRSFDAVWSRFISGYDAVNVTAPFKEEAFLRADIPGDECREVGAANILVKASDGIHAYNSDFLGVRLMLANLSVAPGSTALVLGYGGAGKAAVVAAASLGIEPVICNRTTTKAEGIRPLSEIPVLAVKSDVLINTLPCPIPEMEGLYCPVIVDADYRSGFLRNAADCDRYVSGREWLLCQAITGYQIMTGENPDVAAMMSVISKSSA